MADSAPLIKICGITNIADALVCARLEVEWIGLNFHPSSPRSVDALTAAEIVRELPPSVTCVGVFVDLPVSLVREISTTVRLDVVQLHGFETPEYLAELGIPRVVKAFRLAHSAEWASLIDYLDRARSIGSEPEAVLVDAFVPNEPGGTGALISDEIMAARPTLPRLILAGGLNPENVARRVREVRPWMIDVASGVESSPRTKDPERLAAFVRNARSI